MDTPPVDPPWYRLPPRALLDVPALADASAYVAAGAAIGLLALVTLVLVGVPLLIVVVLPVLALVVARLRTSQLRDALDAHLWGTDDLDVLVAVHATALPRPWDVTVTTLRARPGALELVDLVPPVPTASVALGRVGPAGLVPVTWRAQHYHLSVIHRADPAAVAPHPLNARLAARLAELAARPPAEPLGDTTASTTASTTDMPDAATPSANMPTTGAPPPGWYHDPAGSGRLRLWDGTSWSDRFRDA